MDYIYSELNNKLKQSNTTQYTPTDIEGSQTVDVISNGDNSYRLNVNTQNLVRLIPIKKDESLKDDVKQTYRLVGYNSSTGQFDIPLGEDIVIDHSNHTSVQSTIDKAIVGGVEVPASIDDSGQLVLQYIPATAIVDTYYEKDDNGDYKEVLIQSIIDGND